MKTTLPRLTTIMITGTLAFLSLQAKGDELQDLKKIVAIQQAQTNRFGIKTDVRYTGFADYVSRGITDCSGYNARKNGLFGRFRK